MNRLYVRSLGLVASMATIMWTEPAWPGSLDPSEPPAPTMRTLQEIYDKLEAIDGKLEAEGHAFEVGVPKTGQTLAHSDGDDGEHQRGVPWPDPRFTVGSDTNVVMDNLTGLMWARNANLDGLKNWEEALEYCNDLELGEYSDWRLPNILELESLMHYGNADPTLPSGHPFTNVQTSDGIYWSSTTFVGGGAWGAWSINMDWYHVNIEIESKESAYSVWPVRGGQ